MKKTFQLNYNSHKLPLAKRFLIISFALCCVALFTPSPTMGNTPRGSQTNNPTFTVGLVGFPEGLDCHNTYDGSAATVFQQFGEGLFYLEPRDNEMVISPRLAVSLGVWNPAGTEYTVVLRETVTFHDGARFDAAAVKWNFDRIAYLFELNFTNIYDLYHPFNGTALIRNVTVIDQYTVKFTLNYPFASFLPFLAYEGAYMLSPESTPFNRPLEFGEGDIPKGTGPFKYADATEGYEIHFERNPSYYLTTHEIDEMIFRYYTYDHDATYALSAGEVHLVPDVSPYAISDLLYNPDFEISEPTTSMLTYYLGFNSDKVSQPWRQALSFAVDYDFMNDSDFQYRQTATNLIAPKIRHRLPDFAPKTNITFARELILNNSILGPLATGRELTNLSADVDWQAVAETNPLASFNFTCAEYQNLWIAIGTDLQADFALLGVNLSIITLPIETYLEYYYYPGARGSDLYDMFIMGWVVDYFSPLSSLYHLRHDSIYNQLNYNDSTFQDLLYEAETTGLTGAKYAEIQRYLLDVSAPIVPLQYDTIRAAWHDGLTGYIPNRFGYVFLDGCRWTPPEIDDYPNGNSFPIGTLLVILLILVGIVAIFVVVLRSNRVDTTRTYSNQPAPGRNIPSSTTIARNYTSPTTPSYRPLQSGPPSPAQTYHQPTRVQFCRECGTLFGDEERYCSFCGLPRFD